MYINLLANSMDTEKEKVVHPSFIEIIKNMNTLDAKVFEKISQDLKYQQIINPKITVTKDSKFFSDATPEWYIGWSIDNFDEFDVSASLIRLSKFGLIELMFDRTAGKENYENLKNSDFLIAKLNIYKNANPNIELHIEGTESVVYVNEYGKQFKSACN